MAIRRAPDGSFRVRLSGPERDLLRGLAAELGRRLESAADDADLRRLFPPAYEDEEAEGEYRRLVGDELLAARRDALRLLAEAADRDRLSEDELHACLRALTDLRLVLGTRLGVTEETYATDVDPADPRAGELVAFGYLTWLQEQVVAAAETT